MWNLRQLLESFLEIFIMMHLVWIDKGPVMEWTQWLMELGERYRKMEEMHVEVLFKGATQYM